MPGGDTPIANPAPTVRLRNLTTVVVSGADGPTLQAALTTLFEAGGTTGEAVLVSILRVADYEVLVTFAE